MSQQRKGSGPDSFYDQAAVGAEKAPFDFMACEPLEVDLTWLDVRGLRPDRDMWHQTSIVGGDALRPDKPETWDVPQTLYANTNDLEAAGYAKPRHVGAVARYELTRRQRPVLHVGYTQDAPLLRDLDKNNMGLLIPTDRPLITIGLGVLSLRDRSFTPVRSTVTAQLDWWWLRYATSLR